jgi:3'(2'), 5'-bisphosphate nucleotidase
MSVPYNTQMSSNQELYFSRKEIVSCLFTALRAAKKAGEAIMEIYGSSFSVELKDDGSPLTLADKRSHEIIAGRLRKCPADAGKLPVLSEEGREISFEERRRWGYFWAVDPLDGKKYFIKRNGEFTVNIALIRKQAPIVGVIYVPVKEIFYFGAEGMGARKMDAGYFIGLEPEYEDPGRELDAILRSSVSLPLEAGEVQPSSEGQKPGLTVAGSRSHSNEAFQYFLEEMKNKYGEVEFISAGSSLKFCLVAEGKADVYPRFGPTMEWDSAAGQCIVEQAGGRVVSMDDGLPLVYNKRDLRNAFFVCEGKGVHVFRRPESREK